MNNRASEPKSCESTPSSWTSRDFQRRSAPARTFASALHGLHQEAQKFRTTTWPRSDARSSCPGLSRRGRANAGAGGSFPAATARASPLLRSAVTRRSARIPSRVATSATAAARASLCIVLQRAERAERACGLSAQRPDERAVVGVGHDSGTVVELELLQRCNGAIAFLEEREATLGVGAERCECSRRRLEQRLHDRRERGERE